MDYRYFYIIGSLLFLGLWLFLFIVRKDTRAVMLPISIGLAFIELPIAWTNLIDWWHPIYFTGTKVGIEDFIFAFSTAGIASVIYEVAYRLRLRRNRRHSVSHRLVFFSALGLGLGYITLFFGFGVPTFYSFLVVTLTGFLIMVHMRPDLVRDSVASGILMLSVSLPLYLILFLVFPEYIRTFWYLDGSWYTKLVFGIPVEEYIWLFVSGAFIGPLYEFLTNRRMIRQARRASRQ